MQPLTRRGFVLTAAAAARVLGANDRVRIASVGCGGRGQHLMRMAKLAGGADFVAVCDAWDVRRNEAVAYLEKELPGPKLEQYKDYRKLLERQDIDAVIVASTIQHVPFDSAAALAAAGIRFELERHGFSIGPIDLLIAGTAVSRGAALVTNNTAEFSRVPGLRVLNWKST